MFAHNYKGMFIVVTKLIKLSNSELSEDYKTTSWFHIGNYRGRRGEKRERERERERERDMQAKSRILSIL